MDRESIKGPKGAPDGVVTSSALFTCSLVSSLSGSRSYPLSFPRSQQQSLLARCQPFCSVARTPLKRANHANSEQETRMEQRSAGRDLIAETAVVIHGHTLRIHRQLLLLVLCLLLLLKSESKLTGS